MACRAFYAASRFFVLRGPALNVAVTSTGVGKANLIKGELIMKQYGLPLVFFALLSIALPHVQRQGTTVRVEIGPNVSR